MQMKKIIGLSVLICLVAFAQSRGGGGGSRGGGHAAVGGGHIPAHGPAPARASKPARGQERAAATENHVAMDRKGHPGVPHVDAKGDRWVGHDSGRNDAHYNLAQPWAHGHFGGGFGSALALGGGNRERFWFGNFLRDATPFYYHTVPAGNGSGDQTEGSAVPEET